MIHLVAHRGDMTHYPENTLVALDTVLQLGACYVEFDLQMNRDGDFIVIHDDNFLRTAGIKQSVLETATAVAKKISVHEPGKYQDRFNPEHPPLLEDVLKLLSKHPKSQAFVEIKQESLKRWGMDKVMHLLLERLKTNHSQCILISYDYGALCYTRKHSKLPIGWVIKKYNDKHLIKAQQLEPDYLICNYRKTPDTTTLWQGRWEWFLYDILQRDIAISFEKRGIKFIETGDITALMKSLPSAKRCKNGL